MCVYIYVRIYIHVYMCIYIHAYIHIYTYIAVEGEMTQAKLERKKEATELYEILKKLKINVSKFYYAGSNTSLL